MKQVYCRFCGNQIDEDATFCTHCGSKQDVRKVSSRNYGNLSAICKVIAQKILAIIRIPYEYIKKIKNTTIAGQNSLWRKRMKRAGRFLLIAVVVAIIVVVGICGYSYYYDDYLPKKHLDEACEDVLSKLRSDDKKISLEYSRKILLNNWAFIDGGETWGYDDVSDSRITESMFQYRKEAFKKIESEAYNGNPEIQYLLGRMYIGLFVHKHMSVGGRYFYEREYAVDPDTVKAVYWWNEAAKQGYTLAYNSMGIAYKLGLGVDIDMKKAIEYLKKGAESGDAKAQCNYGDLFRDGVKIHTGTHVVKEPQYIYGHYYGTENVTIHDSTIILPKDIEQALFWWKKSASQGNEIAKERLQKIYE